MLRFFKNIGLDLLGRLAGPIGALIWGIGQAALAFLLSVCLIIEKFCVFFLVVPWLMPCATGWKTVNFIVMAFIVGLAMDMPSRVKLVMTHTISDILKLSNSYT